jgi:redox-sensitive bicupin YhaK (pirin superfamily)
MIVIRKSNDRGHANYGWLDSRHTFSFGGYYDSAQMGFRVLRVINEDRVLAGKGFGTHPHDNMEILSYVVAGELEHKDSLGNGSVIKAGEFQVITAGTGITHSEFNPSSDEPTHFYQIWITPDTKDLKPAYQQKNFQAAGSAMPLKLVASKNPTDGALKVNQDVQLYLVLLTAQQSVKLPLASSRYGWLQVVAGAVSLEGNELHSGDGAALSESENPTISAEVEAEVLFFDLP